MAEHTDKQTLTTELETARSQLAGYVRALRHDLNLGSRLRAGVAENPVLWFAGAAGVGLLISQIPPSRRKVVVKGPALRNDQAVKAGKATFGLTALKFALDFAKPAIVSWIKKKIFERPDSRSSTAK